MGRATYISGRDEGRRQISIHALRGEGDSTVTCRDAKSPYFYPRPPWGGRPYEKCSLQKRILISIHALRGEGDFVQSFMIHPTSKISIHALRGEGDYRGTLYAVSSSEFLSTPSVGRATGQRPGRPLDALISIHALRGEGDRQADQRLAGCCEFLSTPSVGRATHRAAVLARRRLYFYPRPPWGGRPIVSVTGADRRMISIHALRGEGDGKSA